MFPFSVDNCCCTYIIRTALRGNFSAWDKREEKERKREGYSSISGYPSLFIVLNIFYIVNWWEYIPLINRVRGPYRKLWTEFLSSPYGSSTKRAGHQKREKDGDP